MKQHFVILAAAAAALLLLAGCDKQQLKGDEANGAEVSVPVWFEPFGGASTKVDVDGTTGVGTWTAGDQIAIYVDGAGAGFYQQKTVENIEAGNESTGHVMVSLAEGQNRANYAVYPATAAVEGHVAGDDFFITYPNEYDYSNLTVAQMETFSPVPMVAVNTPVSGDDAPALNFYHVGGVLRVTIPGVPQSAYALRFTFPTSFKVSGTFKVSNGGTTTATLADAGLDDHSNVINVKIPVPETLTQTLVLNIPMPSGDYATSIRDIKVEVRTQRIAFMKSDGIVNFAQIARAQGKKQTFPTVETLGTMAEMYLDRGFLNRPNLTTINPADMSLSGSDQLVSLRYLYNTTQAKRFNFTWTELGKIMTNDTGFDGSTSFEDAQLTIDGTKYRVPAANDWYAIIFQGRPGATVNGSPGKYCSIVTVDITGLGYGSLTSVSGLLLYPDGGVYNCSKIADFNTSTSSHNRTLTYAELRALTDGPNACVFIPRSAAYEAGVWSSTRIDANNACALWALGGGYYLDAYFSRPKTNTYPVKLIRVDE